MALTRLKAAFIWGVASRPDPQCLSMLLGREEVFPVKDLRVRRVLTVKWPYSTQDFLRQPKVLQLKMLTVIVFEVRPRVVVV